MASKSKASVSPRRARSTKRPKVALPVIDQTPLQTPATPSPSRFNLWAWALAILVVLGFVLKDTASCKWPGKEVAVKSIGMVNTDGLQGGPYNPTFLCGLGQGKYAVSDEFHTKILIMDLQGKLINAFGKKGLSRDRLHHNAGITTDGAGNLFVLDHELADIFGFNQDGDIFMQVDSRGTGFFYGPRGVAYLKGNFVIADTGSCRVVIMDPAGKTVAKWGERGSKENQFTSPNAVVVTSKGKLVVSDYDNKRLKFQDEKGAVLKTINLSAKPSAITVDAKDRLFVAYGNEQAIDIFNAVTGKAIGKVVVQVEAGKETAYRNVSALAVVDGDKLVAADSSHIWVYQL